MRRIFRYVGSLTLAAALVAPIVGSGCAARATYGARVYDSNYHDYHQWDDHEDASFRVYLSEKHENYRDFSKLNRGQQNDYWKWRHDHPDPDKH